MAQTLSAIERRDRYVHVAMRALPVDMCSGIGSRFVSQVVVSPAMRARALHLFQILRPDLAREPGAYEAMADRLADNHGRAMAEFSVNHRLVEAGRSPIVGEGHFATAVALGRPMIFVVLHLGNCELPGIEISRRLPWRGKVLVAPPQNSIQAAIAMEIRRRGLGEVLVWSPTIWRCALAHLRRPDGVFMLSGEEKVNGRVQGPSFGRALTTHGNLGKAVRLAKATGAIVIPCYNERIAGARFRTHVMPHLDFADGARDDTSVLRAVEQLDRVVEGPVARHLDQWHMAYHFDPLGEHLKPILA